MVLDKKDTGTLRIVSLENRNEDQGLAVAGVSTPNAVVDGAEQGNGPTSKRFQCLRFGSMFTSQCACTSEEDTGDTGEGGDELAEASRGTCRYCCGDHFPLMSTRCEGRLDEYGAWGGRHSLRRRTGGRGGIRSSQSRPGCHLYHLREIRGSCTTIGSKYVPDETARRKQLPSGRRYKTSAHA